MPGKSANSMPLPNLPRKGTVTPLTTGQQKEKTDPCFKIFLHTPIIQEIFMV